MKKLSKERLEQLATSLQNLMEENHEMTKNEIKSLFLGRRHQARNFKLIELSWTDLWREAFQPEMESLIKMAKRVNSKANKNDSLESLSWLLESEFSFLPNAPRLQEFSRVAMKIALGETRIQLEKYSKIFDSWVGRPENKLKILADKVSALEELASSVGQEVANFEDLTKDYVSSISEEQKKKVYELVCSKYINFYSNKYSGIKFIKIYKNKSRISFQGRQIKKSFHAGSFLPPSMLEHLIIKKGEEEQRAKDENEKKEKEKAKNIYASKQVVDLQKYRIASIG